MRQSVLSSSFFVALSALSPQFALAVRTDLYENRNSRFEMLPQCASADRTAISTDKLWQQFICPPDSTRTKVWWFHGETETTREGIIADLEAFRDKGVGGVVYYDQVHGNGTDASAVFSSEWWNDLKFAASETKRLGLTFELNIANGYVAGGPWITKDLTMQKVVCKDTLLSTDGKHDIVLSKPDNTDFKKIVTLAFPERVRDDSKVAMPEVIINDENIDARQLLDGGYGALQKITRNGTMITMDFGRLFTASSLSYRTKGRGKAATCAIPTPCTPGAVYVGAGYVELPDVGELEVSEDGIHYKKVCAIKPLYRSMGYKLDQVTMAFAPVRGRYFRINLHDWTPDGMAHTPLLMGGIRLTSYPTIDNWEVKASFRPEFPAYNDDGETYGIDGESGIRLSSVADISAYTREDGSLRWKAPKGTWRVMMFGYAPTGAKTKHGRKGPAGPECDRMSSEAARLQWQNFFGRICDTLACIGVKPDGLVMDSHEAGAQNWTRGFEHEFRRRCGYDIIPWLPVLSGYVVESRKESERVLYDFRRTIADMISDNFYATIDSMSRASGVDFTAQAIGAALTIAGDNIQSKGRVAKPQGEFWAYQTTGGYDIKEASSAARMYGRNIASAEAFTDATYRHSFAQLKSLADFAYAMGNNEFVVCASAYQPWTDRFPGSTANGRQYCLNRNNTLWPMSRPFWDYQARCAEMLRQGCAVSSLCIYIGDDAPVKLLSHKLPVMPEGYDWDVCTTDALCHAISVGNGKLLTLSGTAYDMFIIGEGACVSPLALNRILELANKGIPVCADILGIERIAKNFGWYDDVVYAEQLEHLSKLGNVYSLTQIAEALRAYNILPQIDIQTPNMPTDKVYFSQRATADSDIFFVYNRSGRIFRDTVAIKTSHEHVELWNPVTCRRNVVRSAQSSAEARSFMLELQPEESLFIVSSDIPACHQSDNSVPAVSDMVRTDTIKLSEPWIVNFDTSRGGPSEGIVFRELTDWTCSADPRIRYYSGEAVYTTTVNIAPSQQAAGETVTPRRYILSLREVNSVARIIVNGHEAATVWCSPWQADITDFVCCGQNTLKIVCANSLVNRVIGDASLPEDKRVTFCYPEFMKADEELEPSGIVGDVEIIVSHY